ncbi:MAG: cytochrome c peroxidase [Pseudomonadota bacterium]
MWHHLRLALVALAWCGAAQAQPLLAEPIRPLPLRPVADPARAALGRALFHDLRLSRDNTQSCASCHQLANGGADVRALSAGAGGLLQLRNTPTVYNSTLNVRQSWIGRFSGIDGMLEHVMGPPVGAASPWDVVASRLTGDAAFGQHFNLVYGEEISAALVKDALANYLRLLVTPSRFDRYLRGDKGALSADEKAGYARFKSYGCVSCHQGINVGGNMYQKFGTMREPQAGAAIAADQGRFELTRREPDRHMFRVPGLRNVARTAPYFHNGSVATLEEAVGAMFKYQLGRDAPKQDQALIVLFLRALDGETLPPPGAQP